MDLAKLPKFSSKFRPAINIFKYDKRVTTAFVTAIILTLLIGIILFWWASTHEFDDENQKNNVKFIGVTMVLVSICVTVLILPSFANLILVGFGMSISGLIGTNVIQKSNDDVRQKAFIAFFMLFSIFVGLSGNFGFLAASLLAIILGSFFFNYSTRNVPPKEKYTNKLLGSLVLLPGLTFGVLAVQASQLRGFF